MIPDIRTAAAVVILLSAVGNYLLFNAWQGAKDELTNFKSAVAEEQKRAAAVSEQINSDVAAGWAAAVAWHRDHPKFVRVQSPNCPLPVPGPPTGVEGLQIGQSGLGAPRTVTIEECESRVNSAVKDAAYIEHVKAWAKKQHEATK